ncbi:putative salicylate hydroxylase [Sarocladium strictum]
MIAVDKVRVLDVIIVGGGIGGLSAAIAVSLGGHTVTVLEMAEKIEEVGAGLQFSANATCILQRWGIDKDILNDVVEPRSCVMRRYDTGAKLAEVELGAFHRKTYGAPFWDIHRHDLIHALHARALQLGVQVRTNSKVVDIDFETPSVILEDGSILKGDLVVGADGLNAVTRKKMVPTDAPQYTGDIAFRILLDREDFSGEEDASVRKFADDPQVTYWLGPNRHAIVYILKGGRQINVVAIAPDDLPEGVVRAPLSKADTLAIFDGWDPTLRKLISSYSKTEVWRWKLHTRDELKAWNHTSERFTLLGDAVHPTLPYLSQGAAMAVEDAAVLGLVLDSKTSDDSSLGEALRRYESLRRPRSTKIVRAATSQQHWYHLTDGDEQERRDQLMGAEESVEGDPFLWRAPSFAPFLYGYDAFEEVKKVCVEGK